MKTLPHLRLLLAPLLPLALLACSSTKHRLYDHEVPLTTEHQQALMKRAKPPQTYGITIYATDDGPIYAGSARTYPRQTARAELKGDRHSTAPIVTVSPSQSGPFLSMLIDTTAEESWLTQFARTELGAVIISMPQPIEAMAAHVYDPIGGWAAIVPKLRIEDLHVENVVFYARSAFGPLGPLARWERDPRISGVLGFDLLRAFNHVTFDFQSRVITFSATTDVRIPPDRILAEVPINPNARSLLVNGRILGEPTDLLLDFAGDFEVASHQPDSDTLRQISLGNLVFRNVSVVSSFDLGLGDDSPPRIGRSLLERYIVTLDFKNRRVLFERPRQ
ncbi:MAG TPA: hypothetical protein PKE55_14400 [Kiritimatiellia bacterium]|nr:hypothetical protein [Kiritimatiellia bacterium]